MVLSNIQIQKVMRKKERKQIAIFVGLFHDYQLSLCFFYIDKVFRGVPRNLKGGRNLKLSVFHTKSSEKQKKGHYVRRGSIFRPKVK